MKDFFKALVVLTVLFNVLSIIGYLLYLAGYHGHWWVPVGGTLLLILASSAAYAFLKSVRLRTGGDIH